jgi:molybdopterin-guanine dinucleotide biosynthesis protein A
MIPYGFIQAGGGSTRFGTDKALVKLGGKTMLERTGELLSGVCGGVLVVAPRGKYGNAAWPVITDGWPGQGPLGGILTALQYSGKTEQVSNSPAASWALILSCDMPFLTRDFLAFLSERASLSDAQVVVPESANGLEPLCACWRTSAQGELQCAFEDGVRKVTEAMKRLPMEVLDEPVWKRFDNRTRLFWNMNTPEDYEQARRLLEREEK